MPENICFWQFKHTYICRHHKVQNWQNSLFLKWSTEKQSAAESRENVGKKFKTGVMKASISATQEISWSLTFYFIGYTSLDYQVNYPPLCYLDVTNYTVSSCWSYCFLTDLTVAVSMPEYSSNPSWSFNCEISECGMNECWKKCV